MGEPSDERGHEILEGWFVLVDLFESDGRGCVEVEKEGNDFESMGFSKLLVGFVNVILLCLVQFGGLGGDSGCSDVRV